MLDGTNRTDLAQAVVLDDPDVLRAIVDRTDQAL